MVFWPGIIGEFMSYLPLTLIITLSSSLFVALVINPVLVLVDARYRGCEADGADARGKAGDGRSRCLGGVDRLSVNWLATLLLALTAVLAHLFNRSVPAHWPLVHCEGSSGDYPSLRTAPQLGVRSPGYHIGCQLGRLSW